MTNYTYSKLPTANFNTTPASIARSATGSVYAVGDTTFTTPLNMTLVIGGSVVTAISSDALGILPDFTLLDRVSCVWKQSGTSFATVLTTSDPIPGPSGATGAPGGTGPQGVPGDVSTWKPTTFYPLNTPVTNPSGDLVKVTTAHTSTSTYDATKFSTPYDAAVQSLVNTPGSVTAVALSATYAQQWKPNTAYTLGQPVVNPSGDVVTAIAAFTSGSTFDATKWNLSPTYAPASVVDLPGFDIVILAGQSNMAGGAALPIAAPLDPTDSKIFQYGNTGTYANQIAQATDPLAMYDAHNGVGPGMSFARWYASTLPLGRRVLLVPVAAGGTQISTVATPRGWRKAIAGNLYANMISQAQGALAAAGANSRLVGVLWVQGESDGDANVDPTAVYRADLEYIINGVRTDLSSPNLPFIIGQMVPEYLTTGTRAGINSVHLATPSRLTKCAVAYAPVGMNMNDGNHFNPAANRLIGRRLFDALRRVQTGQSEAAIPTTPGQAVGLVTSAVSNTQMTLSWTATTGASIYSVEYKLTAGGSWMRHSTPTGTSAVINGLTINTSYDLRVTAINNGGPGPVSAVTTTSTTNIPATTLGITPTALRAYGLRPINSAYAGPAIQVTRADNALLDIGFSGSNLDTAALMAFAGSGDAYVRTWYDQSGNGRNLIQGTLTQMAKVVTAGVMETVGTKPAAKFDGTTTQYNSLDAVLYAAGAASILTVFKAASQVSKYMFGEGSVASSPPQYAPILTSPDGARLSQFIRSDANATLAGSDNLGPVAFDGTGHQIAVIDTGSAVKKSVDAAASVDKAYARATSTFDNFTLGAIRSSGFVGYWAGSMAEIVFFGSAISSGDQTTASANQKTYHGTP